MMIHKRVKFAGTDYWLHDDDGDVLDAVLSPIHHYSDDGELLVNPFVEISYAVIEAGEIKRYGEVIGLLTDLETVTDATA